MGKGIIKSGGADGFYNVELTFEREGLDKTISTIDAHIEALISVIDIMDEGTEKELLKLERNSYIKKKEYLQNNMPEDPTVSAWCADLTEDITGNVGTIEVPGERGIVQIQPGYESNSTYDSIRDGQLQPSIAGTPAATFYNLAMLPGWQKWKPTYRYGVISNIDTDANTCDVKLDEVESSQQNLDINQELNLTGIAVSYMSCDSVAFEDGDNVLVKFEGQTWAGAQVIGFKDNPKSCGFQFKLTRGDGTLITEASGLIGSFFLYNSDGNSVFTTTPTYDDGTECWSFGLDCNDDADPNGYWVEYTCSNGLRTQYPYRYKYADKKKEADLIHMGIYEDIIPYWLASYSYVDIVSGSLVTCPEVPYEPAHMGLGYFVMAPSGAWGKRVSVKSSIPYQITRKAINSMVVGVNNIGDHFFFNAIISNVGICCKTGSGCTNSANTTTGEVASSLITGGDLSVQVLRNNTFDETDYEIITGDVYGKNHDITLTNDTPLNITTACVATGGICSIDGSITGSQRSLSGVTSLMSISANYDY